MTPRRRARALLATVVAALAAGAALAWTPPTFATFCGEPAAYVWEDPSRALAAFYAAQADDPDVRGDPDCLPAARRQSIERSFGDALGWLSGMSFPATPAPDRLGPVFADVAGEPRVRVFLDDTAETADVLACWGTRGFLGLIRFGVTFARGLNRLDDRLVAAHELVHVVQGAQRLFRAASCDPGLPVWVTEGTADAFAGADAIELNVYFLATDASEAGRDVEDRTVDTVAAVCSRVGVPVTVKIGPWFSSVPNVVRRLEEAGARGVTLFNRFYQPDVDLETLEVAPRLVLSNSED